MCILTIKKDEMMNPLHAKSRIVVLGNHEDRIWTKPEKYAPVLRPDSIRLMVCMAMERHTVLKQGNCKNAFCQGILPDDKIRIVKPPIGDPDARKDEYWLLKCTLYGLRRSPHHWYTKINAALNAIGLHTNSSDPCLYTGHIVDPSNPDAPPTSSPLTLGLYVDDFIYFSDYPNVERLFERLLSSLVTVDFTGSVEWFLGTHFQWHKTKDEVSVHLSQTGFAAHLVEDNNAHLRSITPDATRTDPAFQSTLSLNQTKTRIVPPSLNANKNIRVLLDPSVGWQAAHVQTLPSPTYSFWHTTTNPLEATGMPPSTFCTTFT
jgi:hypothetical protein